MTRYEYDEAASAEFLMDVVHEYEDDEPTSVAQWLGAMRRLNAIEDPLARQLIALHRNCGTGAGQCDSDQEKTPISERADWGCETTALIAQHFGVEYRES